MKLAILSQCAIDFITIDMYNSEQIGGSACYCGLTARNHGFDVELHTKFDKDFPFELYFSKNMISFDSALSSSPTTKYKLEISGPEKILWLEKKCEPIIHTDHNSDGTMVNPIFDEISSDTFEEIKNKANFLFLDPQGFLRRKHPDGRIFLKKTNLNLKDVTALKVSKEEMDCLTEFPGEKGMLDLQKQGVKEVIFTDGRNVSLLVKNKIISLIMPVLKFYDSTGLGDIFSATYCCTRLKDNVESALVHACCSVIAAVQTKGIGITKIPKLLDTEKYVSDLYKSTKTRNV